MKRKRDRALVGMVGVSILLHRFLFLILSKNKKEEQANSKPFQMDWHTSLADNNGEVSQTKNKSQKSPQRKNTVPTLQPSLQSALRTDWEGLAKQNSDGEGISQELADVDIAASGVQVNLEKTLRDDLELPLLWKQIRVSLRYRPEHALARISGDVQLRIRIDRYGKLLRIFEESSSGQEELLGWTILCLLEAFREPFLRRPLKYSRTLDLHVQYTMGQKVLALQAKSARMQFVVEGDLYTESDPQEESLTKRGHLQPPDSPGRIPFEIKLLTISTKQVVDTFRDKTLKNHKEWNYYAQRDYYQEQCHRHLNQAACAKLQELTQLVDP